MAVNRYFERLEAHNEQKLFDSLVREDIQISGFDITYIHRTDFEIDDILNEAKASRFKDSLVIEASISENIQGWGGDFSLINQFGLNIDNTGSILIAQSRWNEEMEKRKLQGLKTWERPMEGDLIYFGYGYGTFTNNLFQINHVDYSDANWQHGRAFLYRCKVSSFTPNHNEVIEALPTSDFEDMLNSIKDIEVETSQNEEIVNHGNTLIEFDENNVFGNV